jgi:5-methylcytosine-specific restriction enzyme subunit McrC
MIRKQPLQVFEHQPLKRDDKKRFTGKHLEALESYLGNSNEDTFPYYSLIHNGVKFRQYVGVICVGDLVIEVLPKTDDGEEDKGKWQSRLMHMLSRVYKLDVRTPSNAPQDHQSNSPILDIFINKFLNEVDKLLNRGLVKCYRKQDGNRKALKGKLLIGKHVTTNFVHKERFFVRNTTYDQEHILNRILRQAVDIIPRITNNLQLRGHACSTLFNFPELHEIAVTEELFNGLQFDRKTEDYREAVQIAKLLLLHFRPKNTAGKYDTLALMFDMNKLWEEYVYLTLRRYLTSIGGKIIAQSQEALWHGNSLTKHIRPDIVIVYDGCKYVLDTKWKMPKGTPSDGDLHQMYTYLKLFRAKKVALVYPATSKINEIHGFFNEDNTERGLNRNCDMIFLPVLDETLNKKASINEASFWEPIQTWLRHNPQ